MITTEEFAKKYNVSVRTAQKWIKLSGIEKRAKIFIMNKPEEDRVFKNMKKCGVFDKIEKGIGRPRK